MGLFEDWVAILDEEKDKVKPNIFVFDSDGKVVADRPGGLERFYDIAYQKCLDHWKWSIDRWFEPGEADCFDKKGRTEVILDLFQFGVIEAYLNSLQSEKYLYVYNYDTCDVRWVWLNAAQSADVAEHDDRITGMSLYNRIKNNY